MRRKSQNLLYLAVLILLGGLGYVIRVIFPEAHSPLADMPRRELRTVLDEDSRLLVYELHKLHASKTRIAGVTEPAERCGGCWRSAIS